jgi:hypothetical protein
LVSVAACLLGGVFTAPARAERPQAQGPAGVIQATVLRPKPYEVVQREGFVPAKAHENHPGGPALGSGKVPVEVDFTGDGWHNVFVTVWLDDNATALFSGNVNHDTATQTYIWSGLGVDKCTSHTLKAQFTGQSLQSAGFGGEVAGPVFKRIGEKALAYLGVKPDRPLDRPEKQRRLAGVPIASEGYVDEEQAPPLPGEAGEEGEVLVPDFTGMSIVEVLTAARQADLRLELEGSGRAVAQSPGPGASARRTVCRVSFRPPG